ncbi:MAG: peptidase M16, partial [Gammaproteobacteria bacterium]
IEFAEPENPDSPLVYKGVVYNEMKGAMSSAPATLWHTMCEYLYPTTTYHYNSGGDPACIPDLTYQQLKSFYKTHYHPSNATFMTFGDIPAAELQADFESHALSRFDKLDINIAVPDEQRYSAPLAVERPYAFNEEGSTEEKTHIIMGWLLGKATDLEASMEAHLLSSVLLDNSASPLQKALETTELGTAPSPLCGLDDSQRELCFICGIEGSEADRADALEQLLLDVLRDVAENGIPQEQLEASLHQLELQQREIGGDGHPYGLQLILTALTSATHRGDPIALLNLDPVLEKLRANIQNPEYIKQLARKLLLDNPHRVRLTMVPDTQLSAQREAEEAKKLAAIKNSLDEAGKQALVERAEALKLRQEKKDDESILPKVDLEDVPPEMAYVAATERQASPLPLTSYGAGTNGLVYQQIILPLPALSDEQLDLLPIYCQSLTELGVGDKDYLATQLWQSRVCGSINAYASVRGRPDNEQSLSGHMTLSAKGLTRNQTDLSDLMQSTLEQVRFDELSRIRELIAQTRARRESSVTGHGHVLAMTAAASGISPGARLAHHWSGLAGIKQIKQLDKALADKAELENLAAQLAGIHQLMLSAPRQYLLVGEDEKLADYKQTLQQHFAAVDNPAFQAFGQPEIHQPVAELWKASTQVNFCARAYPTVPVSHPDAAPLTVLGGFLRNGYLHRAIREQGGAYGGGASQENNVAAFRFFSYRDPRIDGTLNDFDASLNWLQNESHEWQQVEEAILGVIGSIDKPGSPAGEAKETFHAELYGRSREVRETFRNRVRQVQLDDLKRVAATYLTPERASTAVITNPDQGKLADTLKLTPVSL